MIEDANQNNKSNSSSGSSEGYTPLTQAQADIILGNDPIAARNMNMAVINKRCIKPMNAPPLEMTGRDFRLVVPTAFPETFQDNVAAIQEALELSREDFRQRISFRPPASLAKEHEDQTYIMQYHALQQVFAGTWRGARPPPLLYMLPRWEGGFRNWKIEDEKAQQLYLAIE